MEEGRRGQEVAGNKRLANPSCQFNLASNPGEMLIRASLPFLPFSSLRPSASASLAHARAQAREPATTLYFRAKIPPAGSAPRRRPRGNCVQSERAARPSRSPFVSVPRPAVSFSVSVPPTGPFGLPPSRNLSRLCRPRGGICTSG